MTSASSAPVWAMDDSLQDEPMHAQPLQSDQVFSAAAETFRLMSAPMRLKIISALCQGEKNVGELLAQVPSTQPNMSQHLNTLYRAGVVGRRREGVQIFYRIIDDRVAALCRVVCTQIAIDLEDAGVPEDDSV